MSPGQADFFHQATVRICSTLDIQEAARRCLVYIQQSIPALAMSFQVYEEDTGSMRIVSVSTVNHTQLLERRFRLSNLGRFLAEWHDEKDIRVVDDLEADPVGKGILTEAGKYLGERLESLMVMRLRVERERFGDVALLARHKNMFQPDHEALFTLLREPFTIALANYLRHRRLIDLKNRLAEENKYLHQELIEMTGSEIVGANGGLLGVLEKVRQVAPLQTPVLITGETGVGKEVVANAIVRFSARNDGPFIKVNCGAIPESLLDSELFGHEKGAFTGADHRKMGRFERADQGTIFLDEIGELPPQAQVRLLRVLQHMEIERVGGTESIPVDIRVIAATNRNLEDMTAEGRFRPDLFYRLNVFPIHVPPLKERLSDLPALVDHFVAKKSMEMKIDRPASVDASSIVRLLEYNWPGNIRELENLVERALIQHKGGPLDLTGFLPAYTATRSRESKMPQAADIPPLDHMIRTHIQKALDMSGGKVQGPGGAAEILRIHPNTLRKRMQRLGIPYGRKAASK